MRTCKPDKSTAIVMFFLGFLLGFVACHKLYTLDNSAPGVVQSLQ